MKTFLLDEMNLIKLVRHFIEPPTKTFLLGTSWSGVNREIRWQSTDIPPKTESRTDISTNVKEEKRSNLMEFFEAGDRLYESKIIHGQLNLYSTLRITFIFWIGRWWRLDDLRIKSNSDLHKLWFDLKLKNNFIDQKCRDSFLCLGTFYWKREIDY